MTVEEGDYDGLVGVMGHLMQVKDRQPAADHMFEPLKETIELLTTYGQELPDAVHQQLQVCLLARTVKSLYECTYVHSFSMLGLLCCHDD